MGDRDWMASLDLPVRQWLLDDPARLAAYEAGMALGYSDGMSQGEQLGYADGVVANEGYEIGYSDGHDVGVSDGYRAAANRRLVDYQEQSGIVRRGGGSREAGEQLRQEAGLSWGLEPTPLEDDADDAFDEQCDSDVDRLAS